MKQLLVKDLITDLEGGDRTNEIIEKNLEKKEEQSMWSNATQPGTLSLQNFDQAYRAMAQQPATELQIQAQQQGALGMGAGLGSVKPLGFLSAGT